MRRTLLPAVLLLAVAAPGRAQEVPARLTLEEALRIAERNQPEYRKALNQLELAAVQERRSWGAFLPSLSATLGFSGSNSRVRTATGDFDEVLENSTYVETTGSSASQGLGLSLTLFDGGRALNDLRSAKAASRAAEAQAEAQALQLRANVTLRFYGVLQAQQKAAVAERLLASSREQLELTRRRFEIGSARREEVLAAEADVAGQEAELERARGELRKQRLLLLQAIGVGQEAEFQAVGELPEVFDPARLDEGALVAAALESNPRIQAARSSLLARERAASAARGARWPRVALNANLSRSVTRRGYEAFFDLEPVNRSRGFSLSFSLPLFTQFQTSAAIAQADVGRADAEEDLRKERIALEVEVRTALIDLSNAYRSLELAERQLRLNQERLELTQERYRVGGPVSFIELQNAVREVASAESRAIDARFAFVNALVTLESKVGREVRP